MVAYVSLGGEQNVRYYISRIFLFNYFALTFYIYTLYFIFLFFFFNLFYNHLLIWYLLESSKAHNHMTLVHSYCPFSHLKSLNYELRLSLVCVREKECPPSPFLLFGIESNLGFLLYEKGFLGEFSLRLSTREGEFWWLHFFLSSSTVSSLWCRCGAAGGVAWSVVCGAAGEEKISREKIDYCHVGVY